MLLSRKDLSLPTFCFIQDIIYVLTDRAGLRRIWQKFLATQLRLCGMMPTGAFYSLKRDVSSIVSVLLSASGLCKDYCKYFIMKEDAAIISLILRSSSSKVLQVFLEDLVDLFFRLKLHNIRKIYH